MLSEQPSPIRDIAVSIQLVDDFVAGFSEGRFSLDTKTFFAVTRCLEIISEASRRIPPDLRLRHTAIPWRAMASAGNVYRHDYNRVTPQAVWQTITMEFASLRDFVRSELGDEEL